MAGIAKIYYNDIKNRLPQEAINYLQRLDKKFVKDFLIMDLINTEVLHKPLADAYYTELFPRGVYLFFDDTNTVIYIGQSAHGLFHRLMSQLDTTPTGQWGWNALLRKLGGQRTGKKHYELSQEDHQFDLEVIKNYKLLLIEVAYTELDRDQLRWLEKLLLKAFSVLQPNDLLNASTGWLTAEQWKMPIEKYLGTGSPPVIGDEPVMP